MRSRGYLKRRLNLVQFPLSKCELDQVGILLIEITYYKYRRVCIMLHQFLDHAHALQDIYGKNIKVQVYYIGTQEYNYALGLMIVSFVQDISWGALKPDALFVADMDQNAVTFGFWWFSWEVFKSEMPFRWSTNKSFYHRYTSCSIRFVSSSRWGFIQWLKPLISVET